MSAGAFTFAYVFKRVIDNAAFHGGVYLLSGSGAGVAEAGVGLDNADALFADIGTAPPPVGRLEGAATITTSTEGLHVTAFIENGRAVVAALEGSESTAGVEGSSSTSLVMS